MAQLQSTQVTGSANISGSLSSLGDVSLSYNLYTPPISAWSSGGSLITARCSLAGTGTQNAGLAIGGD